MRFLITLALLGSLYGQRILYNQDLDKQGQQAAAASKKIASDPLTSQELQNLKTIEKTRQLCWRQSAARGFHPQHKAAAGLHKHSG